MLPSSIPIPRVSGIVDHLERDDASCTQRQTPEYLNRVPECNSASISDAEVTLNIIRQDEPLLSNGSCPEIPALPCPTEATYSQHSQGQTLLEQDSNTADMRVTYRPSMVDVDSDTSVQQVSNLITTVRHDHLHECVQTRMGGPRQWNHHSGTMVQRRIPTTHHHSRVESSIPGHSVLPETPEENATACWSPDEQLRSSIICQQKRRD